MIVPSIYKRSPNYCLLNLLASTDHQDWYQTLAVTDDIDNDYVYTTRSVDDDSELCAYCFEVVKEVDVFNFNYDNGEATESTLYPAGDDFEEITCGGCGFNNPSTCQTHHADPPTHQLTDRPTYPPTHRPTDPPTHRPADPPTC